MEIFTPRISYTENSTISPLVVDGDLWGWVLEDRIRPKGVKIHGKTCIPAGRYSLTKRISPKFNRWMTWLKNVPGFQFIYAHSGNKHEDTEGCLIVAENRLSDDLVQGGSYKLERKIFDACEKAGWENCFWTIIDGPGHEKYTEEEEEKNEGLPMPTRVNPSPLTPLPKPRFHNGDMV